MRHPDQNADICMTNISLLLGDWKPAAPVGLSLFMLWGVLFFLVLDHYQCEQTERCFFLHLRMRPLLRFHDLF